MRVYLAPLILNFIDDEFVPAIGLFRYSIIALLQSGALIIITISSSAILGWFKSSTKIPVMALGLKGLSRDNSSALVFSSLGIYANCTLEKLFNQLIIFFEQRVFYLVLPSNLLYKQLRVGKNLYFLDSDLSGQLETSQQGFIFHHIVCNGEHELDRIFKFLLA